ERLGRKRRWFRQRWLGITRRRSQVRGRQFCLRFRGRQPGSAVRRQQERQEHRWWWWRRRWSADQRQRRRHRREAPAQSGRGRNGSRAERTSLEGIQRLQEVGEVTGRGR